MITTGLFAGYALGVAAITYNISKVKLQDDLEAQVRKLIEYDFSHEKIEVEKDPKISQDSIILVKYKPEENQHIKSISPKIQNFSGEEKEIVPELIYSKVISFSNLVDETKYFEVVFFFILIILQHKFGKNDGFTMKFRADEVQ